MDTLYSYDRNIPISVTLIWFSTIPGATNDWYCSGKQMDSYTVLLVLINTDAKVNRNRMTLLEPA
jgi:hypothetical protein